MVMNGMYVARVTAKPQNRLILNQKRLNSLETSREIKVLKSLFMAAMARFVKETAMETIRIRPKDKRRFP